MDVFVLKLVLTPTLIALVSLAGRRWGPGVSGWLAGLPLTSAPVAFFLALSEGTAFAAAAAAGILAGAISEAVFCLAYRWAAPRHGWAFTLAAGSLAYLAATAAFTGLVLPLAPLYLLAVAALALTLRLISGGAGAAAPALRSPPGWDIPARMVAATAIVVVLTGTATALGPQLTGLLAPYPVYGAILASFAHRLQGPAAAVGVLRGLLLGLFAFATFFLVLGALIVPAGNARAFAAALAAALVVQAGSLLVLRRGERRRAAVPPLSS